EHRPSALPAAQARGSLAPPGCSFLEIACRRPFHAVNRKTNLTRLCPPPVWSCASAPTSEHPAPIASSIGWHAAPMASTGLAHANLQSGVDMSLRPLALAMLVLVGAALSGRAADLNIDDLKPGLVAVYKDFATPPVEIVRIVPTVGFTWKAGEAAHPRLA